MPTVVRSCSRQRTRPSSPMTRPTGTRSPTSCAPVWSGCMGGRRRGRQEPHLLPDALQRADGPTRRTRQRRRRRNRRRDAPHCPGQSGRARQSPHRPAARQRRRRLLGPGGTAVASRRLGRGRGCVVSDVLERVATRSDARRRGPFPAPGAPGRRPLCHPPAPRRQRPGGGRFRLHAPGPRPDCPVGAERLPLARRGRVRVLRHARGGATLLPSTARRWRCRFELAARGDIEAGCPPARAVPAARRDGGNSGGTGGGPKRRTERRRS